MTLCLHPPSRASFHGELPEDTQAELERIVLAAVTQALEKAGAGARDVRFVAAEPHAASERRDPERADGRDRTYRVPGYQDGSGDEVAVPVEALAEEAPPSPHGRHAHLGVEVDEVMRAPSPFEGATIALLSVDRVARIGSPRYAVAGALVRAVRWGNLLFGAGSYAIYEGPYELPAGERRYWSLKTDEPVSRRDLRTVVEDPRHPDRFAFAATGWVPAIHDGDGKTYLLRALMTQERAAIFPPNQPLREEFFAEIRASAPGEAVVPAQRARAELLGEIDRLVASEHVEEAASALAELDAQAFALADWRTRATYLGVLVRAWTREPQERAVIEVLRASATRSELDASLELLRHAGLYDQLFDDLDSELFALLSTLGERFGERGALTLDEVALLMQDVGLIPTDWTSVVAGISFGPAGAVISPDLVAETYEAARGFVRFLGGMLDAIELVVTRPKQLIEGVFQLAQLTIAVELAKIGHRPSQLMVERTLRGIAHQVLFGLRGIHVLGVGERVARRIRWAVVWEVASWFVGVGEVAGVLKAAGVTERIAAVARILGILRRAGEAAEAEALAARAARLARALRAETRAFSHEDELLTFLAHLPDEDVGRLGRLLKEADIAEGATLAALRETHPELAGAAEDALRKAEVLKAFAGKAGGLADEVVEATARLLRAEDLGVDDAARIVAAIPEGEGARFAYALRAVPGEAFARAGGGVELLRALAASPGRMRALETFGYPAYRALWARAGRSPEVLDQYVVTLAELHRRIPERGAVELQELVDGIVEGRPAAWGKLDEARVARFGESGGAPPAAPPAGPPAGGGPPGGGPPPPPPPGTPSAPPGGRPPRQGPHDVSTTGGDLTSGRLPFEPPNQAAVTTGSHIYITDIAGRPLKAEGWVYLKPSGSPRARGAREAQEAATGGQSGLHGAHLIADRFGGAPLTSQIVPFSGEANLSSMKVVENMIASEASSGEVYLQTYVRYADQGKIPAEVSYTLWKRRGGTLTRTSDVTVDFANDRLWVH